MGIGSVADTVSRTTLVPVMIIRSWEEGAPLDPVVRRIVAPLDGAPLSAHAPPTAESLAQQLHVPVHLLTATDLSQLLPAGLTPTVAFNAEVYEEAVSQAQRDAEGWLTRAAAPLQGDGVAVTQEIGTSAPFAVIQEIVQPGDIIVLVSRGRRGAARLVPVNLAAQLIREGSAPVALAPTGDQAGEQSPYHAVPGSPDAWWAKIHQTDRSEPCRV